MSDEWDLEPDESLFDQYDLPHEIDPDDGVFIDTGETPEEEHEAWLRGLPADIRAEYLSRSWVGPMETDPAGFWHHDIEPGSAGLGFAAGGALDTLMPVPSWPGSRPLPMLTVRNSMSPPSSACCAPGNGSPRGPKPVKPQP